MSADYQRDERDNWHLRLLLSFVLTKSANCIDVGSHEGMVLREMMRVAPAGRHIAYEPLPEFYASLRQNFPRAEVRNAALSNESGMRDFVYVKNLPGYSGFRERAYPTVAELERIQVRTERLDDVLRARLCARANQDRCRGSRVRSARGRQSNHRAMQAHSGIRTRTRCSGSLWTSCDDVFELLSEECGLRVFDIEGDGPLSRSEFRRSFEAGRVWNFVAHR